MIIYEWSHTVSNKLMTFHQVLYCLQPVSHRACVRADPIPYLYSASF